MSRISCCAFFVVMRTKIIRCSVLLFLSIIVPGAESFSSPLRSLLWRNVRIDTETSAASMHGLARHMPLYSSLDDDPEVLSEDEEDYGVPRTERDNYVSEIEVAQRTNDFLSSNVATIELNKEISQSFLQYSLSIILGRAIPDARDGLKPVHRRILYAMDGLQLQSQYRKCARVVGEVLGKYHPHGDMAVYDALVRLAQDFSTNMPLIDGHGNFGSVDNDPAAAMRYTECRLTRLTTTALLQDLSENTVDFVSNFDGNEKEPTVLPARLPVLLLNGASGIAVGMATNIPPHNLRELLKACRALVKGRIDGSTVSEMQLLKMIPGPDFPTGACIMGTEGAKKLYTTGNGGVIMRAKTNIESVAVGKSKQTRTAIIVTELPYQVNKASLLEKIAALVNDKKLDGIADLRDESDRDGIRVVIELKRDANSAVVLNNLFKKTPLQTTFSGNFLALMSDKSQKGEDSDASVGSLVPQRFTLREALDFFLTFRFETVRRKSEHQLSKVMARLHIVDGLLIALEKADDVIEIVRAAEDQNNARESLKHHLGTSDEQTDAILRLQLGQLTRLNKGKLTDEKQTLQGTQKELTNLLEVDDAVYTYMIDEFDDLDSKFGIERRTTIESESDGEVSDMDLIKNSRSVIVVNRGGYIKRMPLQGTFESQKRGTRGKRGVSDSSSPDSEVAHCFTCNDHDTLLMITQGGIAYGIRAYQVPIGSRTARGCPIPSVLPVQDEISTILPVSEFLEDEYVVLATENGWIKKTSLQAFEKLTSRGLTIASLDEGDKLRWCDRCEDGEDILIGTEKGMAIRFESSSLRPTGRTSRGVRAINLASGDAIADMNILKKDGHHNSVLIVSAHGFGKRVAASEFRAQARGGRGVISMKFKKGFEEDRVKCLRTVSDDDETLLVTSKGIMVRQKVSEISSQGRAATGVLVQRLGEDDVITSVSIVPKDEDQDE